MKSHDNFRNLKNYMMSRIRGQALNYREADLTIPSRYALFCKAVSYEDTCFKEYYLIFMHFPKLWRKFKPLLFYKHGCIFVNTTVIWDEYKYVHGIDQNRNKIPL